MESRLLQTQAEQAAAQRLLGLARPTNHFRLTGALTPPDWTMDQVTQIDGSDGCASTATWLGAFDGAELVGCLCQCGRIGGRFELEATHPLPRFLAEDPHTVEISRVAVRPGQDEWDILTALLRFSIGYGRSHGHSYHFTTGPYPRPGKLYVDVLGMQLHGKSFSAAESADEVFLYYLDLR